MKTTAFGALVLALLLSALAACSTLARPPGSASLTAQLDTALLPVDTLTEPGFVLRVSQHGVVIYDAASGAADIEQAQPNTPDTVFHIASLSKQITAATLAMAIEEGLVSLEDPVSKWIPEAAKYGDGLTVAHLVYMTSGLTEYTDVPRISGMPWATFYYFTIDEAISASLSVDKLQFEPGTRWQYANINYMLITRIVAQAYDAPFSRIVKDKVFAPLGMSASLINDDNTQVIPHRANAYVPRSPEILTEFRAAGRLSLQDEGGLVMIRRNAPHYGGSGVMTSLDDWSRWQAELLDHKVFGEAFWTRMLSRRTFAHDKTNDAFGLVHGAYEGTATLWYEGGDTDVSSYAITLPGPGLSVTCFSNNPLSGCRDRVFSVLEILNAGGHLKSMD